MGGRHQQRRERDSMTNAAPSGASAPASPPKLPAPGFEQTDAVSAYAAAIGELKAGRCPSTSQVLTALLARDRIQHLLESGACVTEPDVTRLAELDGFLREASIQIETAVGAKALSAWKNSMDPSAKRWWWSLDEVAASARVKLHPSTAVVVTVLLGVSFAITGDNVAQLLKVAALSAGVVAVAAQAALTFFTGSALTETGRKSLVKALASVGLTRFRDRKVLVMAFAVLALSMLARKVVPDVAADFYIKRGDQLASQEAWSRAIESYNRAITLKPSVPNLQLKIAVAYDKSQQFDRALEEYKGVVAADDNNPVALNNLARLYLLEKKEPYSALRLLDRLDQRLGSLSRNGQYALFKNRGWAKMELGLYDDADGDLAAALRVDGQGIAAHYLLGRVLEALKRPSDAQREFDAVIRIVKGEPESASEVEPDWLVYAQRQSLQGGTPK